MQSDKAQAHYIYELLFLVAHETGHVALGHHERQTKASHQGLSGGAGAAIPTGLRLGSVHG
jgi:hypothetical protein